MPIPAPDLVVDVATCGASGELPLNPFVANRYHFGMLLGVDDLETEQGYHRGKTWLHTAWLHGAGTVWGLGVSLRHRNREVVVGPGLAVDSAGRELPLDREHCLDIGRWFREEAPEDLEVEELDDGGVRFVVHVVISAHACTDRPIPAMSEPCSGASVDTAYSRTVEVSRLALVAGPAPALGDLPYQRLRQLFGVADATDPAVIEVLEDLAATAEEDRTLALLDWFRRLAADDVVELPALPDGFPAPEPEPLVLAEVEVVLARVGDDDLELDPVSTADNRVRRSHVATSTIQELLCGRGGSAAVVGTPEPDTSPDDTSPDDTSPDDEGPDDEGPDETSPDDEGPRIDPTTVELDGRELRFRATQPLDERSVRKPAFEVTVLQPSGWRGVSIDNVQLDADDGTEIVVRLNSSPSARPMRVVVRGTGRTPVVGTDFRPIVGTVGGRPGSDHDGHDAAFMIFDEES